MDCGSEKVQRVSPAAQLIDSSERRVTLASTVFRAGGPEHDTS